MRHRSIILSLSFTAGLMAIHGCAHGGAQLIRDDDTGGVVVYLYRDDQGGPIGSRYRKDAIEIMKLRCPQGYTVVKEGETAGLSGVSRTEGTEDQVRRRWAFHFQCKT